MMKLFIRPSIISGLFTDLAAGWFGVLLISPLSLIQGTSQGTLFAFTKTIINGTVSLLLAELILRVKKERS